jgi:hypothetical protein
MGGADSIQLGHRVGSLMVVRASVVRRAGVLMRGSGHADETSIPLRGRPDDNN